MCNKTDTTVQPYRHPPTPPPPPPPLSPEHNNNRFGARFMCGARRRKCANAPWRLNTIPNRRTFVRCCKRCSRNRRRSWRALLNTYNRIYRTICSPHSFAAIKPSERWAQTLARTLGVWCGPPPLHIHRYLGGGVLWRDWSVRTCAQVRHIVPN